MKSRIKLATAPTPDGGEMVLFQHDRDFSIEVNGQDLMHSRQHESELALARLGCGHLADHPEPRVLVGGLGMGYTLRQALDMVGPDARVTVGELMEAVVQWNRAFFGEFNGRPLEDKRVVLKTGDIVELISRSANRFHAILLDVDNGPDAMTDSGNRRLYGRQGIEACRRALAEQGCLGVWSAEPSRPFENRLIAGGFHVRRFRVPAYKDSKSQYRFVWVAATDPAILPPGGGAPRRPTKTAPKKGHRRSWKKRPAFRRK
jgi:spermidine synthase